MLFYPLANVATPHLQVSSPEAAAVQNTTCKHQSKQQSYVWSRSYDPGLLWWGPAQRYLVISLMPSPLTFPTLCQNFLTMQLPLANEGFLNRGLITASSPKMTHPKLCLSIRSSLPVFFLNKSFLEPALACFRFLTNTNVLKLTRWQVNS